MGFVKEFKDFAVRGNMLDLAIGVIIGGAFNNIVKSLTDDIITPLLLTPALNALNLSDLQDLTMFGAVKYGMFISAVINFIIVAFVLFMLVRTINRMRKKEAEAPAAPPAPTASEKLLMEIRDELRKK
ncbi:large-conductance mechanosensitive channel protein MscL [Parasegetibacter sp. NRK P23]|uniref:large-conductance mechanosensitive channel protein MscL n=1 Tax=Parasegetibacter sp. NRK P23 TaxID=2942999 RepID=UPI002043F353|nr:large-conductance mechanosensitive channel protein MscL [Parasegetibacter sp. NRK P23]MCM5530123.1 large-conductance mechanosensitive channel protein MscL [Parasegetibacter sp. NRK P23]